MISQFTLKCLEKAPECLKYGKTSGGGYSTIFHSLLFTASTLQSTDNMIAFNYVW